MCVAKLWRSLCGLIEIGIEVRRKYRFKISQIERDEIRFRDLLINRAPE